MGKVITFKQAQIARIIKLFRALKEIEDNAKKSIDKSTGTY